MPGRTAILPALIAATVPTSMVGVLPCSRSWRSGDIVEVRTPQRLRSPTLRSRATRAMASPQRVGSRDSAIEVSCDGRPSTSRRTMFIGERTRERSTSTPLSARSRAISAPVLPMPTTSTRLPAKGCGVAVVAAVQDARRRTRPGRRCGAARGTPLAPVATTTWRARKRGPRAVRTSQRPSRGTTAAHPAPKCGPDAVLAA